jgi:hypothetical protein
MKVVLMGYRSKFSRMVCNCWSDFLSKPAAPGFAVTRSAKFIVAFPYLGV